jgi:hypothetical protein
MKKRSKPLVLLAALFLWGGIAQAQESVNSSGGDATGSGGTVAYSIGQVPYTTLNGSTGSVAQGVQQAYEIFLLGNSETASDISLTVFPNPTTDNLTLQTGEYHKEKLEYKLIDMQGVILSKGRIMEQQTRIDMSGLSAAVYFVRVVNQDNLAVQSFKIIKH